MYAHSADESTEMKFHKDKTLLPPGTPLEPPLKGKKVMFLPRPSRVKGVQL